MTFGYADKWNSGNRLIIEEASAGNRTFGLGVTSHGGTQYVDIAKDDAPQVALALLEEAGYSCSFMGGDKGAAALGALRDLVQATQVSPLVQDIDTRLRGATISPGEADYLIGAIKARTRS